MAGHATWRAVWAHGGKLWVGDECATAEAGDVYWFTPGHRMPDLSAFAAAELYPLAKYAGL